jgi:hypothetical protein
MGATHTEADFERLSWHDCHIWGLELRAGDPDTGDWLSDLALDIDFIGDWICGVAGDGQFWVAPAELVFHGVTDLKIGIDSGASGWQIALHPMLIDRIERERVEEQRVYLDRPYFRWRIRLNWPAASELTFGAVGFTQPTLAEPVLTANQHLSRLERSRLRGR